MKHRFLFLFFITIYPHITLFSMDKSVGLDYTSSEEGTELEWINLDEDDVQMPTLPIHTVHTAQANTDSPNSIVNKLNDAINKKYSSPYLPDFLAIKQLTESEMAAIIRMVPTDSAHATEIYNKMYNTNNFFAHAIAYFIDRAKINITLVGIGTIAIIEDPKKAQPIAQLNQLPFPIKNAVMERAFSEAVGSDTYTITLDHGSTIHAFDICEATHCAATCNKDGIQNNFYLWNLQSGKKTHTFNEKEAIDIIAFSPDGAHLATALYEKNIIKVWCTESTKQLYTLQGTHQIERLVYSPATTKIPSTLLIIQKIDDDFCKCITECTLTTHTVPAGTCSKKMVSDDGRHQHDSFFGSVYNAKHPQLNYSNRNLLLITKKCALLHFAQLAAKKPVNQPLAQNMLILETSKTYQQLTDVEKNMVQETLRTNCFSSK